MAETPTMEVRARLTAETAQFTTGMQRATQSMNQFQQQSSRLNGAMIGVGVVAGVAGAGIIAMGTKAFMAAARVDELDYALNAVGKSTGMGYKALQNEALEIKGVGIEMEIAQKSVLKFAQNNLELGKASELATIAQDLAIISGENSTETYNKLTHAVITGRSEVLKSVGIQKTAGQMYEEYAKTIGVTTNAMTFQQKLAAILAGVITEGERVFGTYAEAMKAPGKLLRSFKRLHNELQVSVGGVLLKAFGPLIYSLYNMEKAMAKAFDKSETVKKVLEAFKMVMVKLTAPVSAFVDKLTMMIEGLDGGNKYIGSTLENVKKLTPSVETMAAKFEMLLPVLAAATAGFATFAGRGLLQNLPIIGNVLSKLSPLPVALVVLALTSTQVRNALGNLFNAFKPLLPVITSLGKIVTSVGVVAVAVLAKAINILASAIGAIIGFVQRNIAVFKTLGVVIAVLLAGFLVYKTYMMAAAAASALFTVYTAAMTLVMVQAGTAMRAFNMILALNPILKIVMLIVTLITAFVYLMKTNETFASVVKKVFNFIMKVIITAFALIVRDIGNIVKGFAIFIRVLGFVAEVVAKVFEFIMDVILTYFQLQLRVIKYIVDAFINLMESHGVLYDVVKTIFNGIIRVISFVVTGILNTLAFIITGIIRLVQGFNFLLDGAKDIFFAVLDVISRVGKNIFSIFETIAKGIGTFLGSSFDALTGWVRGLANLLGFIPGLAERVNSALDSVKSGITSLPTRIVGLGQDAFDGIINGARRAINGVAGLGNGIEKGLTTARDFLKDFSSKVTEFASKDNGAKIIDAMVKGAKLASGALGTMIEAIQDVKDFDFARTVGNFIDGIANKVDEAGTFLIGLSASMMEFADNTDFASAVGEGIGDFINKIKDSLKEGLGFGDILAEEKKKYNEQSKINDDGSKAAEDAAKAAERMKSIREAMQAGIDSIKGVLDDLRKASGEFADSLKDTIMGFAGLKSIELPDGFIPKAKSLIENMRQRLDKSNQFAQQIATLQAMGLDSGALKDIIESGPVKGAQLAASILGGGAEAIAQINSLQKAISFSGAAIGQYGADAAFGGLIGNAQTQLARLTEAELATRTSGNNQFIQQGAFQVVVNTSGAKNTEEEIKMITDKIEQTFAILAKELAAK
jgi:phage-related protein